MYVCLFVHFHVEGKMVHSHDVFTIAEKSYYRFDANANGNCLFDVQSNKSERHHKHIH